MIVNKSKYLQFRVLIFIISILFVLYFEKNREKLSCLVTKGVIYIMGVPFGIKQSFVVKTTLGNVFLQIITSSQQRDVVFSTRLCCFIASEVYKYTFLTLKEICYLLNNKTYNPIMQRFDSIYLNIDQIVLAVLIFSIFSIFLFNLILFYIYFAFLYLIIEFTFIIRLILMRVAYSEKSVFEITKFEFQKSIFNQHFLDKFINGELITSIEKI